MGLAEILKNRPPWLGGEGPAADVVLSSRIRLARNLEAVPFPSRMNGEAARTVIAEVEQSLGELQADLGPITLHRLQEVPPLLRQALVEKHLISPQLARAAETAALVLRPDEGVSIMVNEEDHLRLQGLAAGLQLENLWDLVGRADDALERRLDYAFSPRLGYLTACPTNTGTGMRASVMMHLPGLVMAKQDQALFSALSKVGIAVRGLYGEGTAALGNIFQVSNQVTLGQSEREILVNLQGVCQQVVDRERKVRSQLHRTRRDELEDRVWRAYGILSTARVMSTREAMALLSDLRLGVDLGVLPRIEGRVINELQVQISPAILQVLEGRELTPAERDVRRAALIRRQLEGSGAARGDSRLS